MVTACGSFAVTGSETDSDVVDKTAEAAKLEVPDYQLAVNNNFENILSADSKVDKDRAAILAMQGEHRAGFHFEETVILQNGYERWEPKDSGGYETVIVVEDSPQQIVLQHILVSPDGHVVKHWRQDWTFEAKERLEFVEDQTWELVSLSNDTTVNAWTQCVYEVSDAPRYCGTGKWNHKYGVSTWTSDRTWRPLPRREYTKRSDYNVINAENRHTVTASGWTHEQDNTKTVREGRETRAIITREFGFNDYRRIDNYDFSPAYNYWSKTSDYWSRVRDIWAQRIAEKGAVNLKTEVDGMPIIMATFTQAAAIEKGEVAPTQTEIEAIFDQWVMMTN